MENSVENTVNTVTVKHEMGDYVFRCFDLISFKKNVIAKNIRQNNNFSPKDTDDIISDLCTTKNELIETEPGYASKVLKSLMNCAGMDCEIVDEITVAADKYYKCNMYLPGETKNVILKKPTKKEYDTFQQNVNSKTNKVHAFHDFISQLIVNNEYVKYTSKEQLDFNNNHPGFALGISAEIVEKLMG